MSDRRLKVGAVLVLVSVLLVVAPALAPVQPLRYHESWESISGNESQIEQRGIEVIAYENLSQRGKQLYVATLENGGQYSVATGEGAPEFAYPTAAERASAATDRERVTLGAVVIERPEDDSGLPPADERPAERELEEREDVNETREEQRRQRSMRYDLMETRTGPPPLSASSNLSRLVAVLLGLLSLGVGGYLLSWEY